MNSLFSGSLEEFMQAWAAETEVIILAGETEVIILAAETEVIILAAKQRKTI